MPKTIQTTLKDIIKAEATQAPGAVRWSTKRLSLVCIAGLVALVLLAFGRTLTTYFIADDFGVVAYMGRIGTGDWNLFWANWTGNFMRIPGINVYRPHFVVSLVSDFLLWRTNAFGYYLTNLLLYVGDTIMLFLVAQRLTASWGQHRSLLMAFFSAGLFAVNPLHCETVSWVVGRVDSGCLLFSLGSIYCFLRFQETQNAALGADSSPARASSSKKIWLTGTLLLYFCGLFFKEMAIGVPVLITAIAILFGNIKSIPKLIAPIWIATAVYFVIRYLALGTLVGGYTGAIGDGQGASAFHRWLDPNNYERLLLPFAVSLFNPNSWLPAATKLIYASALTLVALRLLKREFPVRFALLIAAWLASAAIPIYKLWGIGMDMEGARFCFFMTVPLSMILPVLLFSPPRPNTNTDRSTQVFGVVILSLLIFVGYKTAQHTNANWVHAGKEVRATSDSAMRLAKSAGDKRFVVLGIPKKSGGAHMIYNGATFKMMVGLPFSKPPVSDRFLTFDPIFYGPDQYVNAERFRDALKDPLVEGPYIWNTKKKNFELVPLQRTTSDGKPLSLSNPFVITKQDAGEGIVFTLPSINPWQYDFVELNCNVSGASSPLLKFSVAWSGTSSADKLNVAERLVARKQSDGKYRVLIPVSHYWRWFSSGNIERLIVHLPAADKISIESAQLLPSVGIRPKLGVAKPDDSSGVHVIESNTSFEVNAESISEAKSIKFECSKPDYFFDQIPEPEQSTAVFKTATVGGTTFSGALPAGITPTREYCEVRAIALGADGKPVGEYSEPLILYVK